MRVLCVIDHLGSGGAQRQMVELACGLKHRGHHVEMFVYFPQYQFLRSRVTACRIPVHEYRKGRGFSWGVVTALLAVIRHDDFDIVLSFLNTPNVYAEICKLIEPSTNLLVSERTSHHDDKSRLRAYVRRTCHRVSDHVVVNSASHERWLRKKFRWINGKVTSIYNGVDIECYASEPLLPRISTDIHLLSIGRIGPEKNTVNLLRAWELFHRTHGWVPRLSWVGRLDMSRRGRRYVQEVDAILNRCPQVKSHWRWLGERNDIPALLREHHALIHPSLYEGLPNAVCEALASARPVLVSNVCDHGKLVSDGERGFLFDPLDPQSIADAVGKLAVLPARDWVRLSRNAREYAESTLAAERMVSEYEALFSFIVGSRSTVAR